MLDPLMTLPTTSPNPQLATRGMWLPGVGAKELVDMLFGDFDQLIMSWRTSKLKSVAIAEGLSSEEATSSAVRETVKEIVAWVKKEGPVGWASKQTLFTYLGSVPEDKFKATGMAFFTESVFVAAGTAKSLQGRVIKNDDFGHNSFGYAALAAGRSKNPAAWRHDTPFVIEIEPQSNDGALNVDGGKEFYLYSILHPKRIRRIAVGYRSSDVKRTTTWYEFDVKKRDGKGLPQQIDVRLLIPRENSGSSGIRWHEDQVLWSSLSNSIPSKDAIQETELLPAINRIYEHLSAQ
jgi:hypothetical protein